MKWIAYCMMVLMIWVFIHSFSNVLYLNHISLKKLTLKSHTTFYCFLEWIKLINYCCFQFDFPLDFDLEDFLSSCSSDWHHQKLQQHWTKRFSTIYIFLLIGNHFPTEEFYNIILRVRFSKWILKDRRFEMLTLELIKASNYKGLETTRALPVLWHLYFTTLFLISLTVSY